MGQIQKTYNWMFGYEIMILETKLFLTFVYTRCTESILFLEKPDFFQAKIQVRRRVCTDENEFEGKFQAHSF